MVPFRGNAGKFRGEGRFQIVSFAYLLRIASHPRQEFFAAAENLQEGELRQWERDTVTRTEVDVFHQAWKYDIGLF